MILERCNWRMLTWNVVEKSKTFLYIYIYTPPIFIFTYRYIYIWYTRYIPASSKWPLIPQNGGHGFQPRKGHQKMGPNEVTTWRTGSLQHWFLFVPSFGSSGGLLEYSPISSYLLTCRSKKNIINGDAWSRFFSRTFVIRNMGVSKNSGTPKSSILIRFSIINHPFWGTAIFGNIHMNSPKNHQGPRLWRGEWLCFFSQVLELGSPNHQWPEIPWFSWVCFRWFFPFYHDNHL